MHECDVLQNRLQECNVKFHIEDDSKLIMDSSSPSEAIDLLATSDNRIGLLIAEVGSTNYTLILSLRISRDKKPMFSFWIKISCSKQTQLLSEEVQKLQLTTSEEHRGTDDVVRKLLTEVLIDNARLRKQVNSVLRCSLSGHGISIREAGAEQEEEDQVGSVDLARTVLSKILEK